MANINTIFREEGKGNLNMAMNKKQVEERKPFEAEIEIDI